MAIIEPSLNFEGSHFGERHDPEPGDYTARLVDVHFKDERKSHIRMRWELTNHQMTVGTSVVQRTYTLDQRYIGFLNQHLWCWKRKKWAQLGQDDDARLEAVRAWIGDEANVHVGPWDPERPGLVSVGQVWSSGMSWPPPWADAEHEMD
jgi:hypothetical protein